MMKNFVLFGRRYVKVKNKSIKKQLISCFYKGNIALYCVLLVGTLVSSTLNLIVSWIMQQLVDTSTGEAGALSLPLLTEISAALILLCIVCYLVDLAAKPRFFAGQLNNIRILPLKSLRKKAYLLLAMKTRRFISLPFQTTPLP